MSGLQPCSKMRSAGYFAKRYVRAIELPIEIVIQNINIKWDAYPELPPTAKFPPIKLDDGLFYVNAFEP